MASKLTHAPTSARRTFFVLTFAAAGLAAFMGCRATDYRHRADDTAYRNVARAQQSALGHTEPFTLETPEQTLRRRLMLDQSLPYATPASLGTRDIDPIAQWPDPAYLQEAAPPDAFRDQIATDEVLHLTLTDALQVAAAESREYQSQKETVFRTALQLDLERNEFRPIWAAAASGKFDEQLEREVALDDKGHTDKQPVQGVTTNGELTLTQRFKNGLSFTGAIGLDLVSLLTQHHRFSRGIYADVTATLPLMRGAGEFIVTEPLTQAERNVVYAIYDFERYKREFAVDVADSYLAVLQQLDSVENAAENYERLIASTRRARRLADAGQLPEIQVDQSRQDELRARSQWISALESYRRTLDAFKLRLGLPTDAALELARDELDNIRAAHQNLITGDTARDATTQPATASTTAPAAEAAEVPAADTLIVLPPPGQGEPGPYELSESTAVDLALAHRLDLRVAIGEVDDAQRKVAVAADQLRADVTLLGDGSAGARRTLSSVDQANAILRPDEGVYSGLLTVDLPIERTSEQVTYRLSLISLEQAVRNVQAMEDQVKLDIRNGLSRLLEARESIQIQAQSVTVARRRVDSTNLFLEAGRAEIRDVLEAQSSLLSAQNALTAALVSYRINELALQRDLGLLEVNDRGLWQEYTPSPGAPSDDHNSQ